MTYQSPLRDLIRRIDEVAHGHIAYSQAADAVRNLRDHLSAIARCEETNRELNRNFPSNPSPIKPKPPAKSRRR